MVTYFRVGQIGDGCGRAVGQEGAHVEKVRFRGGFVSAVGVFAFGVLSC